MSRIRRRTRYKQGRFSPRHPHKYVGDVKNIVYRSGLELSCMQFFDRHPHILYWQSEELAIPYICATDGQPHRYFPDFLIQLQQGDGSIVKYLVEVKPAKETVPPKTPKTVRGERRYLQESLTYAKNTAKWAAAKAWCARHGVQFLILTEHDIRG